MILTWSPLKMRNNLNPKLLPKTTYYIFLKIIYQTITVDNVKDQGLLLWKMVLIQAVRILF